MSITFRQTTDSRGINKGSALSGSEYDDNIIELLNNGVQAYENIDALKAVNPSGWANKTVVYVKGYYTSGDGGGGLFYWDAISTSSDNGGSVIQPTGILTGRFLRPNKGYADILEFGARTDGTDIKVFFDNAKLAFNQIKFPLTTGTYNFSSSPSITSNLKVIGCNEGRITGSEWTIDADITFIMTNCEASINVTLNTDCSARFYQNTFYDSVISHDIDVNISDLRASQNTFIGTTFDADDLDQTKLNDLNAAFEFWRAEGFKISNNVCINYRIGLLKVFGQMNYSTITDNLVDGCVTGIAWLSNGNSGKRWRNHAIGNIIKGNHIKRVSEEGISFDCNASNASANTVNKTVGLCKITSLSATTSTTFNYNVESVITGSPITTVTTEGGEFAIPITGERRGQLMRVQQNGTSTLLKLKKSGEALDNGVILSVGSVYYGNSVIGNTIEPLSTKDINTVRAITLYGHCFNNKVIGNYASYGESWDYGVINSADINNSNINGFNQWYGNTLKSLLVGTVAFSVNSPLSSNKLNPYNDIRLGNCFPIIRDCGGEILNIGSLYISNSTSPSSYSTWFDTSTNVLKRNDGEGNFTDTGSAFLNSYKPKIIDCEFGRFLPVVSEDGGVGTAINLYKPYIEYNRVVTDSFSVQQYKQLLNVDTLTTGNVIFNVDTGTGGSGFIGGKVYVFGGAPSDQANIYAEYAYFGNINSATINIIENDKYIYTNGTTTVNPDITLSVTNPSSGNIQVQCINNDTVSTDLMIHVVKYGYDLQGDIYSIKNIKNN